MLLKPKVLTREAFAPYGDVIEVSVENELQLINQGFTDRHHNLAHLDLLAESDKPCISIFRSRPIEAQMKLKMMECHPLSSQAFYPLGDEPYLVLVARKGDLDESRIELFKATSQQGVNYHRGTWHHFCLALNKPSDFLVIDRAASDQNCNEVQLIEPVEIEMGLL